MSCWVVPTIAAEFLGIPLVQVLERARKGTIPSKTELGFTLVDVAPHSPKISSGIRQPTARPATFIELRPPDVSEEEQQALAGVAGPAGLANQGDAAPMAEDDADEADPADTVALEPPLTAQELAGLHNPLHLPRRPAPPPLAPAPAASPALVVIDAGPEDSLVDEVEEGRLDWHHARMAASRQRRAPMRRPAEMAA